jgi:hypothetical protein
MFVQVPDHLAAAKELELGILELRRSLNDFPFADELAGERVPDDEFHEGPRAAGD